MVCLDSYRKYELSLVVEYRHRKVSLQLTLLEARWVMRLILRLSVLLKIIDHTGDSKLLYPNMLIIMISFRYSLGMWKSNSPCKLVIVPMALPLMYTDAYGMGSFVSWSITLPDTIMSCATAEVAKRVIRMAVRTRM